MKILVLAWEFPPRLIGGIARHVAELYPELVQLGHEIHLFTVECGDALPYELVEGIHIYRLPVQPGDSFFEWVTNMNHSMITRGVELMDESLGQDAPFDLIHAHDWLVADAAIALKNQFKTPLISTIHATEYGRHNGIHNEQQRYICNQEKRLTYESWRVIVCSNYMRAELDFVFKTPWNKIDVIYNGIRYQKKELPPNFDGATFRSKYAEPEEKIIYYVGRMTYEKGISVLINACQTVIGQMEGRVKIVIIGGGNTKHLQEQAWHVGIGHKCIFTGFMPDEDLDKFQTIADCAVFPSLYEPFGIVALESFAAKVPVVVSNAGGLSEVVKHYRTGIVTYANNPDSLAWGITEVLKNPNLAKNLARNAYDDLFERFLWERLALQTEKCYEVVVQEREQVVWS
jgi:glycosyltransferase involved in cell wall biosynthesis